jgi:hypothetical protein
VKNFIIKNRKEIKTFMFDRYKLMDSIE